ncbi:MAG: LysM domain-containing protein [Acidobacteriota bacterium]
MFPRTSRYYSVEIVKYVTADQREIVYLRRRFLPPSAGAVIIAEHMVTEGDRLDNVTAKYLGDPEQFWQVCDVNDAMRPDELTEEIGRRLKIPMPTGGQ